MRANMLAAGFDEVRTLLFPLTTYPSGWWSATMACKGGPMPEFRAADADARDFATRYYNAGIHAAAQALPQFMLDAFGNGSP